MIIKKFIVFCLKYYIICKCYFSYWIFGPYGVADVLRSAHFPFIQPILKEFGATVGEHCIIDTGLIIHRPDSKRPFKNLIIHDNCYIGHNILFDLSAKICIEHDVGLGAGCQFWTHYGDFDDNLTNKLTDYHEKVAPITIKSKTVIYSEVVISPGVMIAEKVRVGAGSVVLNDITKAGFYAGVPVHKIK